MRVRIKTSIIKSHRNILPGIPLPSEPILTRWGTWLSAVNYYCENYDGLKLVIFELNSEDATCIANAQRLFEKSNLETNLIYIKANFGFLSMEITRLETSGLLLTESLKIIQNVEQSLENVSNHVGEIIKNKMKCVLSKNPDIKILLKIAEILNGSETSKDSLPAELTADECVYFKYAPITSVDV
ncbi:hypothetical protein QTP88_002091 [Uroleucon formosanum]